LGREAITGAAAEVPSLANDDLIEIEGVIKEVFPGGNFLVETQAGTEVHAHLAGKLRRFHIRVVLGDRVTVAVSPYDLSKGRIVFRHK
jgi:translation initiation factor IF-1